MRFTDKVVIVTGSSRGIGKATALLLAREGAQVIVNCKSQVHTAESVVTTIGPDKAIFIQADISTEAGANLLIDKTMKRFGRIDILINNAGEIFRPGGWTSDIDTWHRTLDANLTSAWLMTRLTAPYMPSGSIIVNVVSVFGSLGSAAVLGYSVAKAGLITLTRAMAKELAPHIRVNAVAPSNVMTDMTASAGDDLIEQFRQATPLKRIADPEEIASTIAFLASQDASYITGHVLTVDGGFSLK